MSTVNNIEPQRQRIVVASTNPVKLGAVADAFEALKPDTEFAFDSVTVSSGVPDQPIGDEQTWRGAHNRCTAARAARPEADYWLGVEGGVDTLHGQLCTFAWIVIQRADAQFSQSRSSSLPLPDSITALIESGMELGHACDKIFGTENAKQKLGAIGLLTQGLYTRRSIYAQASCFALSGFEQK